MIGRLGETEIASVALANQVFFLLILFLFGTSSGVAALLFTIVSFLFSRQVLGVFTADASVIGIGSSYLRIVSVSFIVTAVSFSYSFALRSTGNVKLPMIVSIFALTINTILNYILIFGKLGFPALGVDGAAIATVAARLFETVFILQDFYRLHIKVICRFIQKQDTGI